jgi:hypothetical protein
MGHPGSQNDADVIIGNFLTFRDRVTTSPRLKKRLKKSWRSEPGLSRKLTVS